MPKFIDTHTAKPAAPPGGPPPATAAAADEMAEVYMDAMAFGMGCCCLQVSELFPCTGTRARPAP